MPKKDTFLKRFIRFASIFAVIYTALIIIFPYFRTGSVLRSAIQIIIISILYGLFMAILRPKVEVSKYKEKKGEKEDK